VHIANAFLSRLLLDQIGKHFQKLCCGLLALEVAWPKVKISSIR
jgi:hypothetical protein